MGLGWAGAASSRGGISLAWLRPVVGQAVPSAYQLCNGLQVCFGMFAAAVVWNSRAGKAIVFDFPQPGRAAQF